MRMSYLTDQAFRLSKVSDFRDADPLARLTRVSTGMGDAKSSYNSDCHLPFRKVPKLQLRPRSTVPKSSE